MPAEILAEFSKRRQEMLRAAELGGISLDTKAGGEAAALATRDRKEYGIDTHTWREEVQARASELGFGREEITELLEHGRERLAHGLPERDVSDELALGDRLAGPHGLTERANSFDERVGVAGVRRRGRPGRHGRGDPRAGGAVHPAPRRAGDRARRVHDGRSGRRASGG